MKVRTLWGPDRKLICAVDEKDPFDLEGLRRRTAGSRIIEMDVHIRPTEPDNLGEYQLRLRHLGDMRFQFEAAAPGTGWP